jgi:hypothetical protein
MAHHNHPAKYFVDDKDMFDLLMSADMAESRVRGILKERRIFFGDNEDTKVLIKHLSQLSFDWNQFSRLAVDLDREDREDKTGFIDIICNDSSQVTINKITTAAKAIQAARESIRNEKYHSFAHGGGKSAEITVHYVQVDQGVTRVLQHRTRLIKLIISVDNGRFHVEYTDSERGLEILHELKTHLQDTIKGNVSTDEIDISGVSIPDNRTKYFENMFKGIDGYRLFDVTNIKINRMKPVDSPDDDADAVDNPDNTAIVQAEQGIRKAILSGSGALYSPEFKHLKSLGYFISSAIWQSIPVSGDGIKVEFEAEFVLGEEGKRFRVGIPGVWDRDDKGVFRKSKRRPRQDESETLKTKLKEAALKSKMALESPSNQGPI